MGCVHRHSSSSPEQAYVSVGGTLHACPETHPCPWTFISVLRSGWFDFAIWRSMAYPPHACQSLPRACKRSCLRAGICLTAAFFLSFKKPLLNVPLECSWRPSKKKGKKQLHEAAQERKEVAPQPRGHLTTRRQMPIGRGMCPHHTSCSNSSACTPFLLLTYRATIC